MARSESVMVMRLLIARRDAAAERWLRQAEVRRSRRAHARLVVWDTLLDIWTDRGRRHTRPHMSTTSR